MAVLYGVLKVDLTEWCSMCVLSIWYSMCVGGEVNSAECVVFVFV